MSTARSENDETTISHTTTIGSVAGPMHTGSGDITIGSFSVGSVSTRDEFLAALRAFKVEIDAGRQHGLPQEASDAVVLDLEAAESETKKVAPKVDHILKRLENAKAILVASSGIAAAANKLIPLIEKLIQSAGKVF